MYDLAIIGGGPAGVAAGVYAARKKLKTILIAETIGGQSTDSPDVQNWIGTPHISGMEMAKQLEKHLREYASDVLELKIGERAGAVTKNEGSFSVSTATTSYMAQTVFVATGGGNAGFETAAQLLAYCKSVTLIHRQSDFLRADKATVDAVLAHKNMKTVLNSTPVEVKGDTFVKSISVKDNGTGKITEIPVVAVFVEIGMIPATEPVKDLVALDEWGKIKVDAKNQRASIPGVWAAGDCSDGLYHQNNIAAGDAVKALEDLYYYIKAAK